MPRSFPWLNGQPESAQAKQHRRWDVENQKLLALLGTLDGEEDNARKTVAAKPLLRPSRPPTSIPPASVHLPDTETGQEGIRPGYDADDIWMMTEDEFLETAKLFTRDLHKAEYDRLVQEAKDFEKKKVLNRWRMHEDAISLTTPPVRGPLQDITNTAANQSSTGLRTDAQ